MCIYKTPPEVKIKAPKAAIKGQGLGSTKCQGCFVFIYDTHSDTINLVKECQKLKIPVIILFDNHNIKESNVILTIFKGVNFDKNILFSIISNLLKSLLIKLIYIKKKLIEIEKKKKLLYKKRYKYKKYKKNFNYKRNNRYTKHYFNQR